MKKIGIFLIFFLLFASSCKQEPNLIKKEHYPIEKQENNILINFKKNLIPDENKLFKVYFYMSDFNTRHFDSTFYSFVEIDKIGTLDIRIHENKLIITDIYNQEHQTVIHLDIMFPSYFNETTKKDWVVLEMNEQAKEFFNSTYEIASRSFFDSFQIENKKNKTTINISIFIVNYNK